MKKILLSLLLTAFIPLIFANDVTIEKDKSNVIIGVDQSERKLEYMGSSPTIFQLVLQYRGEKYEEYEGYGENTAFYEIPRNKLGSVKLNLTRILPNGYRTIIQEFSLAELMFSNGGFAFDEIPGKIYTSRYLIPITVKKLKKQFAKEADYFSIGRIKEATDLWEDFDKQ